MAIDVISRIRSRWHPLHYLRRKSWFRALLPMIDVSIPARVGFDRCIYVKAITHAPFYLLGYRMEAAMHELFEVMLAHVAETEAFFDLGANVGVYSWAALQKTPRLSVISVEPDPALVKLLGKTSRRWKPRRHAVVEAAVSDSEGAIAFERDEITTATGRVCDSALGDSFQTHHFGMHGRVLRVRAVTMDGLVREYGPPGLVKIDVEGHELSALIGASDMLARIKPTLLVESFAGQNEKLRSVLAENGYLVFDADRHATVTLDTTNFFALHPARLTPQMRRDLKGLNLPLD